MALRVISLFKDKSLSAGDIATSDIVDLSDGYSSFALSARSVAGTAGTAGTSIFTYQGASVRDGSYATPPLASAIGTVGTSCANGIFGFSPELMPFMKVVATQTGSGTAGKDSVIDGELIVK